MCCNFSRFYQGKDSESSKKIKCTYGKIESKIESNDIQKLIKNLVNNEMEYLYHLKIIRSIKLIKLRLKELGKLTCLKPNTDGAIEIQVLALYFIWQCIQTF